MPINPRDLGSIEEVTVDGEPVKQVTVDGDVVFASIVDDFERGNLDPYVGDHDAFGVQQSWVAQGTWALWGHGDNSWITSHSGLPNYPKRGDRWILDVRYEEGGHPTTWFCCADEGTPTEPETGYRIDVDDANRTLNMFEYDKSTDTFNRFILVEGIGSHTKRWNYFKVIHNEDNSFRLSLHHADGTEVAAGTGSPSSVFRTGGGIKFRKRGSGYMQWDNWHFI